MTVEERIADQTNHHEMSDASFSSVRRTRTNAAYVDEDPKMRAQGPAFAIGAFLFLLDPVEDLLTYNTGFS